MRKALARIIGSVLADVMAAWMLMYAVALLGHPRFGFLELWLAVSVVTTIISIGVKGGVRAAAVSD